MGFQVHFGFEHVGFVGLTFGIKADKMHFLEMLLQHLVVKVILYLAGRVSSVADVTSFMFLSTVLVELVVTVEPFAAESTSWMASKAALVDGPWIVVPKFLVPAQFSMVE